MLSLSSNNPQGSSRMWLSRPEITNNHPDHCQIRVASYTLPLNPALTLPYVIPGSYLEEKCVCSKGC